MKTTLLLPLLLLSACSTTTTTTRTDGKQVVTTRTIDGPAIRSIGELILGGVLSFKKEPAQ